MSAFNSYYSWTDEDILRNLARELISNGATVVDTASGPNVAVPDILAELGKTYLYVAIDSNAKHMELQRSGVERGMIRGVKAMASLLPLRDNCVHVYISHHGIDDVYETEGTPGLKKSVAEAARVVQPGGAMIFSHCVLKSDAATLHVDLGQVKQILAESGSFAFSDAKGARMDWLVARERGRQLAQRYS